MIYTLKNDIITAKISDTGAEIVSVTKNDGGYEYIWQGDARYWAGHAPYLFPICGRLFEGKYTYKGNTYEMKLHGFARRLVFACERISDECLSFTLTSNDDTRAVYPFDFKLTITYSLVGGTIETDVTIENTGEEVLPAALGTHTGFNIPLEGREISRDLFLEFQEDCYPNKLLLSDGGLNTGRKISLPLADRRILELSERTYEIENSLFMENVSDSVTLRSKSSDRAVTMRYSGMPYLGLWKAEEAPFLCIEPWFGLPSFFDTTDDMATKNDMYRIPKNESQKIHMEIIFN